ncbi:PTS transporter subunit EIIC [Vibrio diazotrophicus]|uniref:PTS transporter subunit EIIC n=1 Tax=Vibrio diazotrophicus TaxID=685 RepID=UPI00142DA6C0|nr:PTS transporter subunit EIIC [Vibrio diazotrophicus]NIY91953.1 PTS transporter subunit EIIC [Vibrio diazotrophicus]
MKPSDYIPEIMSCIGGVNNISGVNHCSTRLRFEIQDLELVNVEKLNDIPIVIDAFYRAGQVQLIMGENVSILYGELLRKYSSLRPDKTKIKIDKNIFSTGIVNVFFSTLVGIFQPIVPAIIGAGIIKAALLLFVKFNILSNSDDSYKLLLLISESIYYFIPILLALSCSYKFNTNSFLAISIAGVLVHPELIKMILSSNGINIYGIAIPPIKYTSSIIPIILTVWVMSYTERFLDRLIPNVFSIFLKPSLILVITIPISLIILGPIGNWMGDMLSHLTIYVQSELGWFSNVLLAACLPFFVMFGAHKIFYPIVITAMTKTGFETLVLSSMLASNIAQGAGALTVWILTPKKSIKKLALPAGIAALFGITEAALYGVHLKIKQTFFCCIIGASVAGLFAGIFQLKAYANLAPGLLTLPMFIDNSFNFQYALVVIAISACITSMSIYIWNIKTKFLDYSISSSQENKLTTDSEHKIKPVEKNKLVDRIVVFSPMSGELCSLDEIKDDSLKEKCIDKGVAIYPSQNKIRAPFDGIITSKSENDQSIYITSTEGVELLISLGVNSLEFEKGLLFSRVNIGDYVEVGDIIVEFDIEKCKEYDMDTLSIVTVINYSEYFEIIKNSESNNVNPSKPLLALL